MGGKTVVSPVIHDHAAIGVTAFNHTTYLFAAAVEHGTEFYSSSVKHKHFKWHRVSSLPTSLQLNGTKT